METRENLWAVVGWNRHGDGLLFHGDELTTQLVVDCGCGDHWSNTPGEGVWRWSGRLIWTDDGEDYRLEGRWGLILRLAGSHG